MKFCLFTLLVYIAYTTAWPTLEVINGKDAKEGQFPYQVSIQVCSLFPTECEHRCGGSIISPNWVLSAGHCFLHDNQTYVLAGVTELNETSNFRQFVRVERATVHEDYKGGTTPNDIAIVELAKPLKFSERVSAINLPVQDSNTVGQAFVSGWGHTKFAIVPNTLQYAEIQAYWGLVCKYIFENLLDPDQNPFNPIVHICTNDDTENRGICGGDSGGPLVQDGTLIGISVWLVWPCGADGSASAYTRVSYYIPWIKNHTGF